MPNIDQILAAEARNQQENPATYRAKDLFMAGHLTREELECVAKGEAADKFMDKKEASEKNSGLILPESLSTPVPDNPFDRVSSKACGYVDEAIAAWMPKQIDHVVIRTARRGKPELDDSGKIRIQIGFKLVNVLEQTVQEVATDVTVEREVDSLSSADANNYWVVFNRCLVNQLTQITLQFIRSIKDGQL